MTLRGPSNNMVLEFWSSRVLLISIFLGLIQATQKNSSAPFQSHSFCGSFLKHRKIVERHEVAINKNHPYHTKRQQPYVEVSISTPTESHESLMLSIQYCSCAIISFLCWYFEVFLQTQTPCKILACFFIYKVLQCSQSGDFYSFSLLPHLLVFLCERIMATA